MPGLGKHHITGPFDVTDMWTRSKTARNDEHLLVVDSPPHLDLFALGARDVAITVMVYGQYPFTGELQEGVAGYQGTENSTWSKDTCSVFWTKAPEDEKEPYGGP